MTYFLCQVKVNWKQEIINIFLNLFCFTLIFLKVLHFSCIILFFCLSNGLKPRAADTSVSQSETATNYTWWLYQRLVFKTSTSTHGAASVNDPATDEIRLNKCHIHPPPRRGSIANLASANTVQVASWLRGGDRVRQSGRGEGEGGREGGLGGGGGAAVL